jgi:trehalose utilization protein
VLRSGCCWTRGAGRIFYFSPGHELYPIYHQPEIQRVIRNAIHWARPRSAAANVPRNLPVEEARDPITVRGAQLHDERGTLR